VRVVGFDEDHIGILSSEEVSRRLNEVLDAASH
jgi:hypothetical protein